MTTELCDYSTHSCVFTVIYELNTAFAEALGALVFILVPVVLLHKWIPAQWIVAVTATIAVVWAIVKPLWWDQEYFTSDERGTEWHNILYYLAGTVFGTLFSIPLWKSVDQRIEYSGLHRT